MKVILWWKLASNESYLVMKVKNCQRSEKEWWLVTFRLWRCFLLFSFPNQMLIIWIKLCLTKYLSVKVSSECYDQTFCYCHCLSEKSSPASFLNRQPEERYTADVKLGTKPTTTCLYKIFSTDKSKETEEIGLGGCGGVLKSGTAGSYQHDGWVDGGISQC